MTLNVWPIYDLRVYMIYWSKPKTIQFSVTQLSYTQDTKNSPYLSETAVGFSDNKFNAIMMFNYIHFSQRGAYAIPLAS